MLRASVNYKRNYLLQFNTRNFSEKEQKVVFTPDPRKEIPSNQNDTSYVQKAKNEGQKEKSQKPKKESYKTLQQAQNAYYRDRRILFEEMR
jgi:hypothetical protein